MIAAVLLLAAGGAAAAAPGGGGWNCADPTAQQEMNYCAARDFEKVDAVMNKQWKETAAIMKEEDRHLDRRVDRGAGYFDTLLTAQRAWLSYRDAHCSSKGFGARGGSMQPFLATMCKIALTEDRTKQLQSLIEQ